MIKSYRDLLVWQKSMDLATEIYKLVENLPSTEVYNLTSQMCRAAISVPSNIAEGQSRGSTKDFVRFLYISKGSISELETQIEICLRLNYLSIDQTQKSISLCIEIGKMLNSLINQLTTKDQF